MPKVNSKNEPVGDYGYDIGGGTKALPRDTDNIERSDFKKDVGRPASTFTPDASLPFDGDGYVKSRKNLSSGGWAEEHHKMIGNPYDYHRKRKS